MYETITFETILQRMLDRVPNTVDKREGSIIYDALAPAAVELQLMYIELDVILNETFADTASRDYLIKRAAERGISPEVATNAILKGVFNINVPLNSRFSLDGLNYIVIEKIVDFEFKLQCETLGTEGNKHFGSLIPIEYIDGLTSAELTELLIPGEDDEATEDLRTRYLASFASKAYGGNKTDYIQKTNELAGVGSTKVQPVWNGGGTVKITILDSNFDKATPTLIDSVQNSIDPVGYQGQGLGIAPIGHVVTVDTATEVTVDVSTTITYSDGYTWAQLQAEITSVIDSYLLELRTDWANQEQLIVRISQIETKLLQVEGVIDISNALINGEAANLTLLSNEIPVTGVVSG